MSAESINTLINFDENKIALKHINLYQNLINIMRILITGSSGFLGSPLSDRLEQIGHEIIRVQRRKKEEDFYIENIDGLIEWEKFLEGVDLVIHCAAKLIKLISFLIMEIIQK